MYTKHRKKLIHCVTRDIQSSKSTIFPSLRQSFFLVMMSGLGEGGIIIILPIFFAASRGHCRATSAQKIFVDASVLQGVLELLVSSLSSTQLKQRRWVGGWGWMLMCETDI